MKNPMQVHTNTAEVEHTTLIEEQCQHLKVCVGNDAQCPLRKGSALNGGVVVAVPVRGVCNGGMDDVKQMHSNYWSVWYATSEHCRALLEESITRLICKNESGENDKNQAMLTACKKAATKDFGICQTYMVV